MTGSAYKSPPGNRIAKSDGGTRPSNRLPERSLQPHGGSTPAEASRLMAICTEEDGLVFIYHSRASGGTEPAAHAQPRARTPTHGPHRPKSGRAWGRTSA
jgi:hypothetical protein